MSGATTELSLATAVDADDNADYLTIALANSLRTVDALFSNVSGHTHLGAHQGGPISASSLKGAIDIVDWYRSTGHTTVFATSGAGLEMYYDATQGGTLQAYNRSTSAQLPLWLGGSQLTLSYTNGNTQFRNDGSVAMTGPLSIGGALSMVGALTGATTVAASVGFYSVGGIYYFGAANDTYLQRASAGVIQTNGQFNVSGPLIVAGPGASSITGALTVTGALTASGAIQGTTVTSTQNHYNKGGTYFAGATDQSSFQIWNPGEWRISSSPGNLYAMGTITAEGGPVTGKGAYVNSASSETVKTNIATLAPEACLGQVLDERMRPVSYEYIEPMMPRYMPQTSPDDPLEPVAWTDERLGFIAEEVARVIPQAAGIVEGGTLAHGLSVEALIPVLWGAVRALNSRVQVLEGGQAA